MSRIRSYRLVLDRSVELDEPFECVTEPPTAAAIAHALTKDELVEVFLVMLLTTQNRLRRGDVATVTRGSLSASLVHPREVFAPAILHRAASILLAHNHPGGAAEPSKDDVAITNQLVQVGQLLEIPVVDHIIVTPNGDYFSFAEHKLIPG